MRGVVCWLVQSAARVPAGDDWLGDAELATQAGLRFAKRRGDWRLGRWTAKLALARLLSHGDGSWREIEIRAAADGAPEPFLAGRRLALSLSLSHSGDRALCAVAPAGVAVGCDVEAIEPRSDRFVADYFTAGERRLVARGPADRRALVANLVWSAKESALKLLRQGLRLDTRSVELTAAAGLDAGGWQRLELRRRGSGEPLTGWWRRHHDRLLTVVTRPPSAPPSRL